MAVPKMTVTQGRRAPTRPWLRRGGGGGEWTSSSRSGEEGPKVQVTVDSTYTITRRRTVRDAMRPAMVLRQGVMVLQ